MHLVTPLSLRQLVASLSLAGALLCGAFGCSGSRVPDDAGVVGSTTIPRGTGGFLGIDRVGYGDANLTPDGQADYVIDTVVRGPVTALILLGEDSPGVWDRLRGAEWDTIVGDTPLPPGLPNPETVGRDTDVVGVYEGDRLLNAADGSLSLPAGSHALRLYASQVGGAAHYYRVVAQLPDGSTVSGDSVMYY
jgi:hypothetical protein